MVELIEKHREQIKQLCRKHGVKTLELFGSAARGEDFDPSSSDVDFFVEFVSYGPGIADRWFGLGEDLEALLGRRVDLVSSRAALRSMQPEERKLLEDMCGAALRAREISYPVSISTISYQTRVALCGVLATDDRR